MSNKIFIPVQMLKNLEIAHSWPDLVFLVQILNIKLYAFNGR